VFEDEANVEYAVKKLTTPEAVEKSRVLPFRFFDALKAYEHFDAQDMRIEDAIRQGLELSFVNLPNFGKDVHVTIGTDVSGSMSSAPVSEKGSTMCIDIAGIFTGALLKRTEKVLALPFDTQVVNLALSKHDSIAETAKKIADVNGGGTALGSPIEYLLNRKIKTDVFIGITDNEDWAYGQGFDASADFLTLWHRYKKEINPNAVAFLVTIAPYAHAVAPQGEKGVHFIYGWSEKVLNYISLKLSTGESQVESISKMKL
jgi:60 kDa SS-A/Ro ribonucleoprotein